MYAVFPVRLGNRMICGRKITLHMCITCFFASLLELIVFGDSVTEI
jgi:hypothetical protein